MQLREPAQIQYARYAAIFMFACMQDMLESVCEARNDLVIMFTHWEQALTQWLRDNCKKTSLACNRTIHGRGPLGTRVGGIHTSCCAPAPCGLVGSASGVAGTFPWCKSGMLIPVVLPSPPLGWALVSSQGTTISDCRDCVICDVVRLHSLFACYT